MIRLRTFTSNELQACMEERLPEVLHCILRGLDALSVVFYLQEEEFSGNLKHIAVSESGLSDGDGL